MKILLVLPLPGLMPFEAWVQAYWPTYERDLGPNHIASLTWTELDSLQQDKYLEWLSDTLGGNN